MSLTKKQLSVLEKVFSAEIEDRLPFQFGRREPKIAVELEKLALIRRVKRHVPGGRFVVLVEGWELTPRGHMAFCYSCADKLF